MNKDSKKLSFLCGIILGLLVFKAMQFIVEPRSDTKVERCMDTTIVVQKDTFALNQKSVYDKICKAGIEHPDIVLRQSLLETGYFTSPACLDKHNLFGFMDKDGVKVYRSYEASIKAYKGWQDIYYPRGHNYYDFLDSSGYAEDTSYVDKLKQVKLDVQSIR